ncbi:MAG: hybrid sensor histidine kinase/response regulator [Bacteroidetes bacterium]|nr:MAG: hybrid sensor histidine kinase/response regulator [Bacteroidota bacterium]
MCNLKTLFFFSFLACCVGNTFGQRNIHIDHYTKGYGMNFRWVYDITQDDQGLLWFATHTGLRRYDGTDFVTYTHAETDSNSISSNTIKRVSKDHDGNIWAYSDDRVFNRLHLATGSIHRVTSFIKKGAKADMRAAEMKAFRALDNGAFLVLFQEEAQQNKETNTSLWKFNFDTNVFEHLIDVPTQGRIDYFTEGPDGKIWLWGMGRGYYLVDLARDKATYYNIASAGTGTQPDSALPIDGQRNFWYPSNTASTLKNFRIPNEVDIAQIERITLDNLDNIWFYQDDQALYHFNRETGSIEKFVDPMFRKSTGIQIMYHFFVDNEGGYWNGHFLGAVRFSKKSTFFNTYLNVHTGPGVQNQESFSARDIIELSPGSLLVKENNHDLFSIDLASRKTKKFDWKLKTTKGRETDKEFYSAFLGSDGHLWANQADKLIKINIKTGASEVFDIPESVLAKGFDTDPFKKYWPRIFEDAAENIWWCDPEKLSIYDRAKHTLIAVKTEMPPLSVNADFKFASYDATSDAIYASCDNGVYVVDCKNRTVSLLEIFSHQEKYDVLITNILKWKNEFWLSTNKGLIRYNPKTKKRTTYSRKDGLPSNIVGSTLGAETHLWLATSNGLCQFDPETLQMVNFNTEQGLPNNHFNNWSYLKTKAGNFYFGGKNGIVGFDPSTFKISSEKKGRLNLVEVSKYDQKANVYTRLQNLPYAIENEICVGPDEKTLSFTYQLARYGGANQYFHLMEGLDNDWINDGNTNQARYVQVPPGKYVFRAKAKGPHKVDALNEIAIPVVVLQYWYLRWWAVALYLILFAAGVGMLYKAILRRKYDRLEAARVKELDKVKTRMYTNITHEFRTPLTVMLGMNDAVPDYAENGELDKVQHASKMIDRNGRNLLNLVNQMLELAKVESGRLDVNNQQGNIVDYLKYRLESFQSYAKEKNIHIHFSPQEAEIMMDYDVDKISYILNNLVSNAIKFTPSNGDIFIEVRQVSGESNEPYAEIKVADTGVGIKPDELERIFDRFYQVSDPKSPRGGGVGTGIGLALVKELVKLLKGTITVESVVNSGSTFTVRLPITNKAPLHKTARSIPSEEWSESLNALEVYEDRYLEQDQNIPLVLVVEDNADVSHYITVSIQSDYRIVRARDGLEGIEKAIELIPDIIISDVMMPGKDGFELCQTLKQDERTSHIPIILLTGKADVNSKIEGLQHGADVYLAKPFNRTELLVRLKNLMTLRAEIQKRYAESDFTQSISALPEMENAFLVKVKGIILEHLDEEEFGIVQLCEHLHVSRAQLHRKLTAFTGESTSHLIRKIRLEKAKELLASGEFNVSEVAYMIGFKTQAHFSRVFAEAFGIAPSDYRNK